MSSSPSAPSWTSLVSDASSVDGVRGALESVSAAVGGVELKSRDFASAADQLDSLATFRSQFSIPKARDIAQVILNGQKEEERGVIPESVTPDQDSVYLCGNSLGPKRTSRRSGNTHTRAAGASWLHAHALHDTHLSPLLFSLTLLVQVSSLTWRRRTFRRSWRSGPVSAWRLTSTVLVRGLSSMSLRLL